MYPDVRILCVPNAQHVIVWVLVVVSSFSLFGFKAEQGQEVDSSSRRKCHKILKEVLSVLLTMLVTYFHVVAHTLPNGIPFPVHPVTTAQSITSPNNVDFKSSRSEEGKNPVRFKIIKSKNKIMNFLRIA